MEYRILGRTGWKISEVGYGMWGLGGQWGGADDIQAKESLDLAVENGVNFFDTAWAYSEGHSEQLLGQLIKKHQSKKLYIATKIPPKNFKWPSQKEFTLEECFPGEHIIKYTEKSLKNLGIDSIDLMQFHVWEDHWADNDDWKEAIQKLKKEGKIKAVGISINRWEPENSLQTIQTGEVDVVQVIYNIFDQAPEDSLFPLCRKMNVGIISRVPFDEGTLTGNLTADTKFPEEDWRSTYFVPENLIPSVKRSEDLKAIVPPGMTLAELALRFILKNPDVTTTIPGMRKQKNVLANTSVSDGKALTEDLLNKLRAHRWDRKPTWWSQ